MIDRDQEREPGLAPPPTVPRLPRGIFVAVLVLLFGGMLAVVVSRALSQASGGSAAVSAPLPPDGAPDPPASGMRSQQQTTEAAAQPLPSIAASPLILTYHDVWPGAEGPYNVTPERFAQDMASLHAAGWRTVGTSAYLAWLDGRRRLPDRTLVLTFDDGTAGSWIWADPILRRYDYRAIAFIATGFVGKGNYYVTWPELHAMEDSGRWDIEAHSHDGHRLIVSDQAGSEQPFLINRAWSSGALEPLRAFRARVTDDLDRTVESLRERGFDRPRMFAYPFAAAEAPTNDPLAARFAQQGVRRLFRAAMTDNVTVMPIGPPARFRIPRLGVTSTIDLPTLFASQQRRTVGPAGLES